MKEKIKVAIVINDFLVGGAQKQLTLLIPKLDRERFDISLVTLFDFGSKETLYHRLPDWLVVHKLRFTGLTSIRSWIDLFKTLKRESPDIVMSSLFTSNLVVRILKPFIGYKVITREHNTYIDKNTFQIILDKILSPFSYRIVAVSPTVARFTSQQEWITLSKFVVIENGIDALDINHKMKSPHLVDGLRMSLELNSDRLMVNVSRLVEQKNHMLMIRAFAKFSQDHRGYKLLIVGDGPLRKKLQAEIKDLSMEDKIIIIGHKDDVLPYLSMSDIFLSTSKIEGLSNAYLEALACGLPLVSTMTAGTDMLINDGYNGFFIKENVVDIVKVLSKAVDSDLSSLSKNALSTAKEFDISITANKYQKLLEECYAS